MIPIFHILCGEVEFTSHGTWSSRPQAGGPPLFFHCLFYHNRGWADSDSKCNRRSQNRLKPLAADDVEQRQRRAFGLFGSALQLRDIAVVRLR